MVHGGSKCSQMVKIELKIGKLIFHSFLNIAQHFGQKKWALFEEGGQVPVLHNDLCVKYYTEI